MAVIKLVMCYQRILVVKVVPNPEKPGTFLFGASSLRAFSDTHLSEPHRKCGFSVFLLSHTVTITSSQE